MTDVGGLGAFKGVNPYAGFSKSAPANPATNEPAGNVSRDGFESSSLPPLVQFKSLRIEGGDSEAVRTSQSKAVAEQTTKQSPRPELIVSGDFNNGPTSAPGTLEDYIQAQNNKLASGEETLSTYFHPSGWKPVSTDESLARGIYDGYVLDSRTTDAASYAPMLMSATAVTPGDSKLEANLGKFLKIQVDSLAGAPASSNRLSDAPDACLMSDLKLSEEIETGPGWNYDFKFK